ncbi:MAG: tRNA dihydrouridine synthase DusB [Desulfobacteraceae bacterium]|nr:tRNA dihydrouridine synthase DusB [Desulfobacteraceae bacterium]
MKIGNLHLEIPTIFAPLAGITNLPMRLLAKEAGCGLVCSEMISSNGLVYGDAKTRLMLESCPRETPLSVQLFGYDPEILADAAAQVQASGAAIVDINFGCSVKKILKSGSGSALMRDPQRAQAILKAVRAAIDIPLTIKMRTGWDPSGQQAFELAQIAQDRGVQAVAIHPRIVKQGFSGHSDWSIIRQIKQLVSIPVIGNGDIITAHDASRMMTETDCNAVMIGRSAIGNPFIFTQIRDMLNGSPIKDPSDSERIALMLRYVEDCVHYLGETKASFILRSRLTWFAKGMRNASHFRNTIRHICSGAHAKELILAYQHSIKDPCAEARIK